MQTISSFRQSFVGSLFIICSVFFLSGMTTQAQVGAAGVGPFRTQTIQLKAGWNAVYLEVEPLDTEPSVLFLETPIGIAAGYFRPSTSMEFLDSPADLIGDRKGWSVWYAPERDDALLTDLYSMQAHRAYLIYSNEDYTWSLRGIPYFDSVQWYANSFCLVGFQIDAANAPTLSNFFAGAAAHQPLNIYRMVDGRWARISAPAATLMESGVAYWAQSTGASDFSGPFEVNFSGAAVGGLVFTEASQQRRLEITNVSDYPQDFSISLEAGETGLIPLAYIIQGLNASANVMDSISVPFPAELVVRSIEPGEAFALELEVFSELVSANKLGSNLVITSDAGLRVDVPILSIRSDLLE
ncbi:hypothetical protein ACWPKO_02180 [Coraliomargarita sp. W4R53]